MSLTGTTLSITGSSAFTGSSSFSSSTAFNGITNGSSLSSTGVITANGGLIVPAGQTLTVSGNINFSNAPTMIGTNISSGSIPITSISGTAVNLTSTQTITGLKTFSSTITGNLTGTSLNSTNVGVSNSVTDNIYLVGQTTVSASGFYPLKQNNNLSFDCNTGLLTTGLTVPVGQTLTVLGNATFSNAITGNLSGNSSTSTIATNATNVGVTNDTSDVIYLVGEASASASGYYPLRQSNLLTYNCTYGFLTTGATTGSFQAGLTSNYNSSLSISGLTISSPSSQQLGNLSASQFTSGLSFNSSLGSPIYNLSNNFSGSAFNSSLTMYNNVSDSISLSTNSSSASVAVTNGAVQSNLTKSSLYFTDGTNTGQYYTNRVVANGTSNIYWAQTPQLNTSNTYVTGFTNNFFNMTLDNGSSFVINNKNSLNTTQLAGGSPLLSYPLPEILIFTPPASGTSTITLPYINAVNMSAKVSVRIVKNSAGTVVIKPSATTPQQYIYDTGTNVGSTSLTLYTASSTVLSSYTFMALPDAINATAVYSWFRIYA